MLDLFRCYPDMFGAGSFLDVGANLGQTLIKYKAVFRDNLYVGFEPNSTCAAYVTQLIESNKWSNCHILSAAVADHTGIGELLLYYDKDVDAGASLIDGFRKDEPVMQTFKVPVLNLSETRGFTDQLGRLACIKIDVEGGEYEVIKSCHQIIQEQRPLLLVEILPAYDVSNVVRITRQQEIEGILSALNYKLYVVLKDDRNCLKGLKKIETVGINDDIHKSDYLFVPGEMEILDNVHI